MLHRILAYSYHPLPQVANYRHGFGELCEWPPLQIPIDTPSRGLHKVATNDHQIQSLINRRGRGLARFRKIDGGR